LTSAGREVATLAGGCFWCLEAVYLRMKGVESVVSGYMGGRTQKPSYKQICTGTTGHAEVVQITFDPAVASFRDLLAVFFAIHDPTTLNRQGKDAGTQYRSAIFHHTPGQEAAAREVISALEARGEFDAPIVTEVTPASTFWPAEDYHQRYYDNNSHQPYCMFVVEPKVEKFLAKFREMAR
jgi:peptide-methionine (S)-S-oxide reductase